jgi:2-polyprenyl-3-methyl-5-hydroxy-6-metoxy-1,4-benzoquinol methylase
MPTSPALSDLISAEYLAEQKRLHADPKGYGGRGSKWAKVVADLIVEGSYTEVLDYGCGQATLGDAVAKLNPLPGRLFNWVDYDPARKEHADVPAQTYDLVVCTDVLEHIEPEKIDAVLAHLRTCTRKGGELFTVISTVPTEKRLSDGRQAHILLQDRIWWTHRLEGAGFHEITSDLPNPKPEKQFVTLWEAI